ncbi:phage tail protein [Pseudomonas nitroreducens]|uniref:phage tail protein n=1 Tax=Pseudomonas nitroreducens TaxID=46680 RepID=UPI002658B68A|nr:phage tail protein [Pseudomonas nitroreducens]MCP1651803.1 hypothetical protein [Pseudomonas nitroreducens]MCP1689569.1 hypothetical protein [Pseudomonas nitroreducens]
MAVTYYAILTNVGAAKLANAAALGTTLNITQLAVGDGNGNVPVPDATRTALVREVRRAPLNRLSIDPANASQIIAEQVIPENVGGWWIREIGLYDETGALVAIANCAPSYKPQLAEGSGRTQTVRMILIVNNSGSVELKIDPSIVLATREYVDSAITAAMNRQDIKQSVRAATTANISLSGQPTVDGIALLVGDRVLVKNQTTGSQNGIYVVAAGAWSRSADADENAEVTASMMVPVESGTLNADTIWQLITDGPIVIGTTALTFRDITDGFARLLSPAFTGTPTAPTAAVGTKTTQLATTAFARTLIESFGLGVPAYQPIWPNTSLNDCTNVPGGEYRTIATTTDMPPGFGTNNTVSFSLRNGVDGTFQVVQVVKSTQNNQMAQRVSSGGTSAAPTWSDWTIFAATASPVFTGNPQAPTAPQFDNDTSLATTEFVKRALGNFATQAAVTTTRALTLDLAGQLINCAGNITVTLPSGTAEAVGAKFQINNTSNGTVTVQAPAGQSLYGIGNSTARTFALGPGDSVTIAYVGGNSWYGWGGIQLGASAGFAFSTAGNGYQKLPSGLIIQWGAAGSVTSAGVTVTFPIAFPNAQLATIATVSGLNAPAAAYAATHSTGSPKTNVGLSVNTGNTAVGWIAIGY